MMKESCSDIIQMAEESEDASFLLVVPNLGFQGQQDFFWATKLSLAGQLNCPNALMGKEVSIYIFAEKEVQDCRRNLRHQAQNLQLKLKGFIKFESEKEKSKGA